MCRNGPSKGKPRRAFQSQPIGQSLLQAVVDATSLVPKPGISREPGLCGTSALSDCSCWCAYHGEEAVAGACPQTSTGCGIWIWQGESGDPPWRFALLHRQIFMHGTSRMPSRWPKKGFKMLVNSPCVNAWQSYGEPTCPLYIQDSRVYICKCGESSVG